MKYVNNLDGEKHVLYCTLSLKGLGHEIEFKFKKKILYLGVNKYCYWFLDFYDVPFLCWAILYLSYSQQWRWKHTGEIILIGDFFKITVQYNTFQYCFKMTSSKLQKISVNRKNIFLHCSVAFNSLLPSQTLAVYWSWNNGPNWVKSSYNERETRRAAM